MRRAGASSQLVSSLGIEVEPGMPELDGSQLFLEQGKGAIARLRRGGEEPRGGETGENAASAPPDTLQKLSATDVHGLN